LFYDLYGFQRSSSGANGLNVLKCIKKLPFFGFFAKKINFFPITGQFFLFFPVHDYIQSKKSQLAKYDIFEMFAENLIEVVYVWWVDSGFFFFFEIIKKILNLKVAHCFY
jgi:hypothetical protein